jgi:hypothetical protein
MQVLLGSVGKKEDGDAEKVINIQMAAAYRGGRPGKGNCARFLFKTDEAA